MDRRYRFASCLLVAGAALVQGQQASKSESNLADLILEKARQVTPAPAQASMAPSPPQKVAAPAAAQLAPAVSPPAPSRRVPQRAAAQSAPQSRTDTAPMATKNNDVPSKEDLANRMINMVSEKPQRQKVTLDSRAEKPPRQKITLDSRGEIPIAADQPAQSQAYATKLKDAESMIGELQNKLKEAAAKEKVQQRIVNPPKNQQKSEEAVAQMSAYQKMQEAVARELSSAKRVETQKKPKPVEAKHNWLKEAEDDAYRNKLKASNVKTDPYAYQKKLRESEPKDAYATRGAYQKKLRESNTKQNLYGMRDPYQNYFRDAQREKDPYAMMDSFFQELGSQKTKSTEDRRHKRAADAMMDTFNMDRDGLEDLDELVEGLGRGRDNGLQLEADADGDNAVTVEELAQLLGQVDRKARSGSKQTLATRDKYLSTAASVMQNLDADSDGKVSISEILDIMDDGIHDSPSFKGWHKGFREADRNQDMQLNLGELADLFQKFDETEL
mmetsp:Transcript_99724/g.157849  ORF Transcript_99724/g.157849 Transcript_99724/m.157849 type:complete len:500 (-) Transcript_99724:103-1602(-)